jgi:hypothetical protein
MQIASQPRYPMVRSVATPAPQVAQTTAAPASPAQAAPAAPPASAQASEAFQAFSQKLGAFTQKAQSFLTNLWDTVLGPALNSLISMIKGAFGG